MAIFGPSATAHWTTADARVVCLWLRKEPLWRMVITFVKVRALHLVDDQLGQRRCGACGAKSRLSAPPTREEREP